MQMSMAGDKRPIEEFDTMLIKKYGYTRLAVLGLRTWGRQKRNLLESSSDRGHVGNAECDLV